MGLWDRLKKELIDIVEWIDDSSDTMVHRFERFQNEIKNGAKLVVREGQAAVFIKEGKLAGTLTSDQGERKLEGTRRARMPRAVGNWNLKFKMGDREITNALIVTASKEGKLAVDWKSGRVKSDISGVKFERGKLVFNTKIGRAHV